MRGREEKQIKSVVSHKDWDTEKEHKGRSVHLKKNKENSLYSQLFINQMMRAWQAVKQLFRSGKLSITAAVDELDAIILSIPRKYGYGNRGSKLTDEAG